MSLNVKEDLLAVKRKLGVLLFNFAEHTLEDGTILIYDEIVEGAEVFTYDENNDKVYVADGSYTVEEGIVIEVLEGKIVTITLPEPEVIEAQESEIESDEIQEVVTKEDFNILESKVSELEAQIVVLAEMINKINESVLAFAKEPIAVGNEKNKQKVKVEYGQKVNPALKYFK